MNASCLVVAALSVCAGIAHAQAPPMYGLVESHELGANGCDGCGLLADSFGGAQSYGFRYLSLLDVGEEFDGSGSDVFIIESKRPGKRINGSVQYYSRDSRNLSPSAKYGLTDSVGLLSGNRAWGLSLGLERGGIALRVAHQNKNVAKVAPSMAFGNTISAKNTILAANVKVGFAKVYAAYSASRGWGSSPLWNPDNPYGAALSATPSSDSRDKLVGIALPLGATTLLASFIRKNDRDLANHDADQLALGATYSVSRRTDFYTTWSSTRSRNIAGQPISTSVAPGSRNNAINVGMRHAF